MSRKLLQIDTCLGVGSTGRITASIAQSAQRQGWECFIVHGARYVKRPSCMEDIQSVSTLGEYVHFAESLLLDKHGLASTCETKRVIEQIKQIKPDIIHLHCVHGYYLNYKVLFEYLETTDLPVVWTFHDCWAFTGHCAHFDKAGCDKWLTGCAAPCPCKGDYPRSILFDKSKRNYELKRTLFTAIEDRLTIVPVSNWLESFVKKSFLKNAHVQTIHNGINLDTFKPQQTGELREKLGLKGKHVLLGVAMPWSARKGVGDMFKLAGMLPEDKYATILVGVDEKQIQDLPENVIGIKRTNNATELAVYYSMASVFVNPTYEDTYPTTNLEALACGTPVITYRTGGSPEAIDESTGVVVQQGDVAGLAEAIKHMGTTPLASEACRRRAEELFDKDKCFQNYINLYESIL